jgi:hypothetical protein
MTSETKNFIGASFGSKRAERERRSREETNKSGETIEPEASEAKGGANGRVPRSGLSTGAAALVHPSWMRRRDL